jgi:hypothetical protein
MLTQFKNPLITIGITLVSGLTSVAISAPAYSITLVDLSTFTSIGNVTSNNTVIKSGSLPEDPPPVTIKTGGGDGSLEEFLEINPNSLATAIKNNTYGSAIKKTLSFNAGDQLSFNWTFGTSDQDQAFVSIGNEIALLSGSNPYSYTFPTSGNYQVAMGVLDVWDSTGVSTLTLSNAQIQPVPWETDTLPVLGSTVLFGIGVWAKRKYARNSQS